MARHLVWLCLCLAFGYISLFCDMETEIKRCSLEIGQLPKILWLAGLSDFRGPYLNPLKYYTHTQNQGVKCVITLSVWRNLLTQKHVFESWTSDLLKSCLCEVGSLQLFYASPHHKAIQYVLLGWFLKVLGK